MNKIQGWFALAGGFIVVFAAIFGAFEWVGWPPYAAKADFKDIEVQVQANSLSSLYIQLENAIRSGDRNRVLRLCWAIQQQTGQKPAGCP